MPFLCITQERFRGTLRFIFAYASFPNSVTLRFADYKKVVISSVLGESKVTLHGAKSSN